MPPKYLNVFLKNFITRNTKASKKMRSNDLTYSKLILNYISFLVCVVPPAAVAVAVSCSYHKFIAKTISN